MISRANSDFIQQLRIELPLFIDIDSLLKFPLSLFEIGDFGCMRNGRKSDIAGVVCGDEEDLADIRRGSLECNK